MSTNIVSKLNSNVSSTTESSDNKIPINDVNRDENDDDEDKNTRRYECKYYYLSHGYVLTSWQFDAYYEYLKQRGNVRFTFHNWPNINNDTYSDKKIVEHFIDRSASYFRNGSTMYDIVYVRCVNYFRSTHQTFNTSNQVDIRVNWFRSTPDKEIVSNAYDWIKLIRSQNTNITKNNKRKSTNEKTISNKKQKNIS
jgi:hypothetical protein